MAIFERADRMAHFQAFVGGGAWRFSQPLSELIVKSRQWF